MGNILCADAQNKIKYSILEVLKHEECMVSAYEVWATAMEKKIWRWKYPVLTIDRVSSYMRKLKADGLISVDRSNSVNLYGLKSEGFVSDEG